MSKTPKRTIGARNSLPKTTKKIGGDEHLNGTGVVATLGATESPGIARPLRWVLFVFACATASVLAFVFGRYSSLTIRNVVVQPSKSRITHLPRPDLAITKLKAIPPSLYSFRLFQSDSSSSGDSILLSQPPPSTVEVGGIALHSFDVTADGLISPTTNHGLSPSSKGSQIQPDRVETLPGPSGHHLLVDIEHVDAEFLDSEDRLAQAMLETVQRGNLTMLSYHCHGMEPFGVSCVGVLLNGHISLHTWPFPGVITLDLFTCESKPLLPFVEHLRDLFGVPKAATDINSASLMPRARWAFKRRGFDPDPNALNPKNVELDEYIVGRITYEVKEKVVFSKTKYQTVEIFDIVDPKRHSLKQMKDSQSPRIWGSSYESRNPDLFRPDRVLFLDKIMQSRRYGEGAYHEALVHPAMLSHWNPRRVAIIGGGEGATLREVLKHRTVERVTMIEIDEAIVNISRTWLPEWSDCSSFASTASCFDDPRTEHVYYRDAVEWFLERYGNDVELRDEDLFDVIVMDALDPSNLASFSDDLYRSDAFLAALSKSLGPQGVLVAQVGVGGFIVDGRGPHSHSESAEEEEGIPPPVDRELLADVFVPRLLVHGFAKIKGYTEAYSGFWDHWTFVAAFKDWRSVEPWHQSQAMTELDVRRRVSPSSSTSAQSSSLSSLSSSLRFFDGAVLRTFSHPSRYDQETFCRKHPVPRYCGSELETAAAVVPLDESVRGGRGVLLLPSQQRLLRMLGRQRRGSDIMITSLDPWRTWNDLIDHCGWSTPFYGDVAYWIPSMCPLKPLPPEDDKNATTPEVLLLDDCGYNPSADRNHWNLLSSAAAAAAAATAPPATGKAGSGAGSPSS